MSTSNNDDTRLEPIATVETQTDRQARAWREIGHRVVWIYAENHRWDLNDALHDVIEPLENDELISADDIHRARSNLDIMRQTLEETLAPIADGAEPWEDGAGSTTPYNVLIDQLEERGYTVARPNERVLVLDDD
ncbi:hypothetical protein ACYJ1Y_16180 [Natrialbaceae archaeon A-gly3]